MKLFPGAPAYLDRTSVQGTRALNIRNTPYHLIKRDMETGEFKPVDKIESSISSQDLEANYGVWEDKEITRGAFIFKTIVRFKDGQIQPDEVKEFKDFRKGEQSVYWSRAAQLNVYHSMEKAEISTQETASGPIAVLNSDWSIHSELGRWHNNESPLSPANR